MKTAGRSAGFVRIRWALGLIIISLALGCPPSAAKPAVEAISIDMGIYERNKTRSVEQIIADLRDSDPIVRSACSYELGRRKNKDAADSVAVLLTDKVLWVRVSAAIALVELEDNRGFPVLRSALATSKQDRLSALQAAVALAKRGQEDGMGLGTECLSDSSPLIRRYAIDILSRSRDEDIAFGALDKGVADADQAVASRALSRLGDIGGARSVEALAKAASRDDLFVRTAAIDALGRTAMCDAIPILIDLTGDAAPFVRVRANAHLLKLTEYRASPDRPNTGGTIGKADWLSWWEKNRAAFPLGKKVQGSKVTPER